MATRRNFIKKMSIGSAACTLASTFIDSLVYSQVSELLEIPPEQYYYLGISFPGGPPRWMFDLPLYTNDDEKNKLIQNPMVFTKYNKNTTNLNDGTIETEYSLNKINDLLLPPIWESSINVNGGKNSLSDLARNCLFMRGMTSLPFHSGYYKAFQPRSNIPAISSLSSMKNNSLPLPGVQFSHSSVKFNHPQKIKPLLINNLPTSSQNLNSSLHSIFNPFILNKENQKTLIDDKINQALERLQKMGKKNANTSVKLHQISEKARSLMSGKIENLIDQIETAYESYIKINEISMRHEIGGIDDLPIFNPTHSPSYPSDHIFNPQFPDIPVQNYFNSQPNTKNDFREILRGKRNGKNYNACCFDLCFSLAMAEVLFKNKITNSLLLPAGLLRGTINGTYNQKISNDSHNTGAVLTHLFFSKYFQTVGHCLNHFIKRIGPSIFNKTVIHLASEFSRSARIDASGSDHGNTACQATLISGMIKKPKIVGDIDYEMAKNIKATYHGTWGQNSEGRTYSEVYAMTEELFEFKQSNRIYKNPPLKKEDLK
jgi:hypothetical protein